MNSQEPTIAPAALKEVQKLLQERAKKKHELDNLDKAIENYLGLNSDVRPVRPILTAKNFKTMALGTL